MWFAVSELWHIRGTVGKEIMGKQNSSGIQLLYTQVIWVFIVFVFFGEFNRPYGPDTSLTRDKEICIL